MAIWNILLYSSGALFALRSLLSLMARHKQHMEHTLRLQARHAESRKTSPSADETALSAPAAPPGKSAA